VWKYFDYILISADVKVEKPHSAFYQRLIEWLNEKPENILFIDDDSKNIEWAKIAWLQTLLYDRSKNLLEEVLKNM
jgi:HAD superfamily hydrolase (TIGR01509 family)